MPERVFIERIRRDSTFVDAEPDTVLHAGDVVGVVGRRRVLLRKRFAIGIEVEDRELLNYPVITAMLSSQTVLLWTERFRDSPSNTGAVSPFKSSSEEQKKSHSPWRRPCSVVTSFASSAPHSTWSV